MILAGPGVPAGHVCATNTNLVDVAPTVLAAAGVESPNEWSGRSLIQIANEPHDPARIGFSEYHAVGSPCAAYLVREGYWAYHHYVGYQPELFDERSDPEQAVNLAADLKHRPVVAHMEALLREHLDPEATDRRAKDDQNALVNRFGGRAAALQLGPKGATPAP